MIQKLDYKNTKYLFMGDATTTIEDKVEWDEVDVLKVAHHGSNTSTSQEFLDKINPKYAIISVGSNKKYGFPKEEIINRLMKNNITIYRIDENGTIWITSDGENINIQTIEYNLDGAGRKQAYIFEIKYLLAFRFTNYLQINYMI